MTKKLMILFAAFAAAFGAWAETETVGGDAFLPLSLDSIGAVLL